MTKATRQAWQAAYAARLATYQRAKPQERRGALTEEERAERARDERKARGTSRWAPSLDRLPGSKDPRRMWRNACLMALKDRSG